MKPKLLLFFASCGLLAYWLLSLADMSSIVVMDDFIAYWAAGRLQWTGQNPYSFELFSKLQESIGWQERPHVMLYPPWAFLLLVPLGIADYASARLFWLLLNLILLTITSSLLWKFYAGPPRLLWVAWGLAFLFYPSLYLLRIGQMSLVVLFGLVTFLVLHQQGRHWWAGCALFLAAIKPHLAYLFWIALILWIVQQRHWRILTGLALMLLLATVIPMTLNANLIVQASAVWQHAQTPVFEYNTPTLGTMLRKLFDSERRWANFVPMSLAIAWLLWHWRNQHRQWNWGREAPMLLAVSVWTCFYSWVNDLILLLPVLIQSAIVLHRQPQRLRLIGAACFCTLNLLCLAMNLLAAPDLAYVWLGPVMVIGHSLLKAKPAETVMEVGDRAA
jgi:Glycosyltransferase family 87